MEATRGRLRELEAVFESVFVYKVLDIKSSGMKMLKSLYFIEDLQRQRIDNVL